MRVAVLGAGGHARSVIEAVRLAGDEPVACTDPGRAGGDVDGVPVVGGDERLADLAADGVEGAVLGVGGVGDNSARLRACDVARAHGLRLRTVIHPRAHVAAGAQIGAGSVVLALAVVGPGASLGEAVIVNTGALVEHDCRLEDGVHVATGAALGGGVVVARSAHVGLGASVLQGLTVGAEAVVGAGAVVTRDVAPGVVVTGVPAREQRPAGRGGGAPRSTL